MKTPVIITPKTSGASWVLNRSARYLKQWYKKMGYTPEVLEGIQVRRFKLQREMNKIATKDPVPRLACYYGHGTENSIMGMGEIGPLRNRPIFHLDRIGGILTPNAEAGYIFYTYACSNYDYVKDLVETQGAICAYGAKDELFIGSCDTPYDEDRIDDFIDMTTVIPRALALGKSTYEAFDMMNERVAKYRQLYKEHEDDIEGSEDFITAMDAILKNYTVIGRDVKWVKKKASSD